jgi:hypothetical protein
MSPRRTGLPTFAPQSVIIEFHQFDGRWFVTDKWQAGSGTALKRNARKSALGKTVLDRVNAARSEWRTVLTASDEAELWAHFCNSEAGVPEEHYQPEKRLVILAGQVGFRCRDARQSPPIWAPLPSKSPRKLGKALLKRMSQLEPAALAPVPVPEPADAPASAKVPEPADPPASD